MRPTLDKSPEPAARAETAFLQAIESLNLGLALIWDISSGLASTSAHSLLRRLDLADRRLRLADIGDRVHPDDRSAFDAITTARPGAARKPGRRMIRMLTADGTWLWIKVRASPLATDDPGAPRRMLALLTDGTADHVQAAMVADAVAALTDADREERRRLGRELHDSTAQELFAVDLSLAALGKQPEITPGARKTIDECRSSIVRALRQVRSFSFALHPPSLDQEGFEPALRAFCTGFAQRTGLSISLTANLGGVQLDRRAEHALFRVAQEALVNAYRHGHARNIDLRLEVSGRKTFLEVEDDGVGFPSSGSPPSGVGLRSMGERMQLLGGKLEVATSSGGFTVRGTLPTELPTLNDEENEHQSAVRLAAWAFGRADAPPIREERTWVYARS
jgi:signal transduction histidine kinase